MPFGTLAVAATTIWLVISANLIPLGLLARRIKRQPLSDRLAWAGLLAIGSLSSLLVLTLIRDVVLLVGYAVSGGLLEGDLLQRFQSSSAVAVPILAGRFLFLRFLY